MSGKPVPENDLFENRTHDSRPNKMTNTYYKQKYDQMMLERIPEAGKNVTSMPVSEQLYSEDGKLPIAYRNMNAPHMIVENTKQFIPENRPYLMRKGDVEALEEQRRNTADGNTGFGTTNWDWYKTISGFGDINTVRFFTTQIDDVIHNNPFRFGNIVHGKSNAVQSSQNQFRGHHEQRMCDWQMHQLHVCLAGALKTDNTYRLFPNPNLPDAFGLRNFVSRGNMNHPDCTDFRLLAEHACDEFEMQKFIRTENRLSKQRLKAHYLSVAKDKVSNVTKPIKEIFDSLKIPVPDYANTFWTKTIENEAKEENDSVFRNPRKKEADKNRLSELRKQAEQYEMSERQENSKGSSLGK